MNKSTPRFAPNDEKSIQCRCFHLLLCFCQSVAFIMPVTLVVINALTVVLIKPSKLLGYSSTAAVLNTSECPFNTFTLTSSCIPTNSSTATTLALMYVLVLPSSNRALIWISFLPLLTITGMVLNVLYCCLEFN